MPVPLGDHIFVVGCTHTNTTVTPLQLKVTVGRPVTHTLTNSMSKLWGICKWGAWHLTWPSVCLCVCGYLVDAVHCRPPDAVRVQYFPAAVLKAHFLSSRLISNWNTSWSPSSSWLADRSMPRKVGQAVVRFHSVWNSESLLFMRLTLKGTQRPTLCAQFFLKCCFKDLLQPTAGWASPESDFVKRGRWWGKS